MDDIETLTETERLLLMAAAVHGLGPGTDLSRANTARVVNQALLWLGVSPEEIRRGWEELETHKQGEQLENHPGSEAFYAALVRMTHQLLRGGPGRAPERAGPALFEGSGNWGVPGDPGCPASSPYFNSCRLTARGEQIARELLVRHPEYRMAGS
jgi:hypothetical protein